MEFKFVWQSQTFMFEGRMDSVSPPELTGLGYCGGLHTKKENRFVPNLEALVRGLKVLQFPLAGKIPCFALKEVSHQKCFK